MKKIEMAKETYDEIIIETKKQAKQEGRKLGFLEINYMIRNKISLEKIDKIIKKELKDLGKE